MSKKIAASVNAGSKVRLAPAQSFPRAACAVIDILFILYLALLLRLTVFRPGFSFDDFMLGGQLNTVLFGKLIDVIRNGGAYYFFRLFLGNIAAFVPIGAYLAFRSERSVALITLIGALSSAAIEAIQFMFDVGFTEIDDVILNTLGALLGAAAVRLIAHGTRKKKE